MTALVAVLLHFGISLIVAAVFFLVAAYIPLLRRVFWSAALVYGVAVNLFMGMAVLPLSVEPKAPMTLPLMLNGMIGDTLFIGLPLAIAIWLNTPTGATTAKAWRVILASQA
jgi:uncharacterized membrane protein YagU involved in acid resistance